MEVWKRYHEKELSHSMAHYLQAVAGLKKEKGYARVGDIADRLGVSKSGVTSMLRSLASRGLVDHERYGCVELTASGRELAARTESNRQLLTVFFRDVLGVPDDVAERGRLHDRAPREPGGDDPAPAPDRHPELRRRATPPRCWSATGARAASARTTTWSPATSATSAASSRRSRVRCRAGPRVAGERTAMNDAPSRPPRCRERERDRSRDRGGGARPVRRLMDLGLVPGHAVRYVRAAPLGDPLELVVRGTHLSLRRSEAGRVHVEPV